MTTRNIVNYLGEVCGTLELPDDTSEATWAEKLACYSQPPPTPQVSMVMLATSLVVAKAHDIVAPGPEWEDLGGITTNPMFFDADTTTMFGLITGSFKTTGAGAQLALAEEFDGEGDHQLNDPPVTLPDTQGTWVTIQFITNQLVTARDLNRAFMLEGRLNGATGLAVRFMSLSLMKSVVS